MKTQFQRIARVRIKQLFEQAEIAKDPSLSKRYISLARTIAMKYKLRVPALLQRAFCKHCYTYFRPGKNMRARTHRGHVVHYCLECKKISRYPYKK